MNWFGKRDLQLHISEFTRCWCYRSTALLNISRRRPLEFASEPQRGS